MGKKPWATEDQRTWLESEIPNFVRAQQEKTVSVYMKNIYNEWEAKWPSAPLTEAETKDAKGNCEKALAIKRNKTAEVRT